MALTKEQEKELEEIFASRLKEQYNRGLQVGVLSVSKVVLDKLNDGRKPLMDRIKDVKNFCEIPINKQKQIEKALKEASEKAEKQEDVISDSTENNETDSNESVE